MRRGSHPELCPAMASLPKQNGEGGSPGRGIVYIPNVPVPNVVPMPDVNDSAKAMLTDEDASSHNKPLEDMNFLDPQVGLLEKLEHGGRVIENWVDELVGYSIDVMPSAAMLGSR